MKRIYNIESIEFEADLISGRVLLRVAGRVNSGGWGPPSLRLLSQYSQNGFQHFEMISNPPGPGTLVSQAFAKKQATFELDADGLIGVVVHASANELSKKYESENLAATHPSPRS